MNKIIKDIGVFSLVCIAFVTPILAPIIVVPYILGTIRMRKIFLGGEGEE